MTETDIMNLIRMNLSEAGFVVFRANVGKMKLPDGRWFDTGLPKGFSDLFAVKDGRIYFIEVKKPGGIARPEQINFISQMKKHGCIAGIAHSVEEAFKLVNAGS
ncbi:MAG: VRR-NUC domain-containing protein [Oscillospiraceae bacterium]|nr:VRR-NUC domain-containing protein [Oscillospiraceae bacterium]